MNKLELLANVLEYIEGHITEDIHTDDIAKAVYCSRSSLEKLFRFANHISVRDYIMRRRMTRAGKTLVEKSELSILDVAVMYGYSSNEAFTRAFRQVWYQLPSDFRARKRASELYPRINPSLETGDDLMEKHTKFDIRDLYDIIVSRQGCRIICSDIQFLIRINEISRKAGDLAIIEAMRRLDEVATENDLVFRIGGDEFVLLTDSPDEDKANEKLDRLLAMNGNTINFEGKQIPLSLYACNIKLEKADHYNEMFSTFWHAILDTKAETMS